MTDEAKKPDDEIAALRAEVEALKAAQPKPQQSAEEIERSMARARDELHQMREGRMAYAMHPSVVRDMAGGVTNADIQDIVRASHRPQGPNSAGAIPSSQQVSNARGNVPSGGTGWVEPRPLTNPPGTNWVDAIAIADDVRQRAELARKKE